jgi:hypothetical protein
MSAGRSALHVRHEDGAKLTDQQRGDSDSRQPAGCHVIHTQHQERSGQTEAKEMPKSFQALRRAPGFVVGLMRAARRSRRGQTGPVARESRYRPAVSPPTAIDAPPMTYISTDIAAPAGDYWSRQICRPGLGEGTAAEVTVTAPIHDAVPAPRARELRRADGGVASGSASPGRISRAGLGGWRCPSSCAPRRCGRRGSRRR